MEEKKSRYNKDYYEKHKEELREYNKKWYSKNKEKMKEWHKDYYKNNKDKCYDYNRKWQKDNKEKFTKLCNESRRRRVERLRSEGCKNAWAVVSKGVKPKYENSSNN